MNPNLKTMTTKQEYFAKRADDARAELTRIDAAIIIRERAIRDVEPAKRSPAIVREIADLKVKRRDVARRMNSMLFNAGRN